MSAWGWIGEINASGVAAAAAMAGAAAAWFAAIIGSRTLRRARIDSQARSRPMVAAELRDVPYIKWLQTLVIRNYGPSIARNLRVTFNPPIPEPDPAIVHESVTPFLKRRYAEPIAVLTPGMELDNIWFSGHLGAGGELINFEPTPEQFTVTISYEGDDGSAYSDKFSLDVDLIRDRTTATSTRDPEYQLVQGMKALVKLERVVRTRLKASGPSQKPGGGLGGLAEDDMRKLLGDRWEPAKGEASGNEPDAPVADEPAQED